MKKQMMLIIMDSMGVILVWALGGFAYFEATLKHHTAYRPISGDWKEKDRNLQFYHDTTPQRDRADSNCCRKGNCTQISLNKRNQCTQKKHFHEFVPLDRSFLLVHQNFQTSPTSSAFPPKLSKSTINILLLSPPLLLRFFGYQKSPVISLTHMPHLIVYVDVLCSFVLALS